MVEIRKEENPSVSEIEKIEIDIDQLPLDAAGIREPKTLHEGRFSIYFIAALALREGRITIDSFTEDKVTDPELILLRKKVQARGMFNAALSAKARVTMKDGRVYERYTPAPKGSTENPVTFEALKDKFKTTSGLSPAAAEGVIDKIMHMEQLASIKEILSLLQ
jgi:2-methylcitrate dehydratase PrpD